MKYNGALLTTVRYIEYVTYFFYITIININMNSALSKAYILHKYFKMELQPQFLLISHFFFFQ